MAHLDPLAADLPTLDPLKADLTTSGVTEIVPGRPAPSTVWRWMTKGVKGIRLESVLVAGTRYTDRNSVRRFLLAINGAPNDAAAAPVATAKPSNSSRRRQAKIDSLEKQLEEAGA